MELDRTPWRAIAWPFARFVLVSLFGTMFSLPLYLFLVNNTHLGVFGASIVSNLLAQAIDFFPHKLLTFKERRLEGKVISLEAVMYSLVALFLLAAEPFMLYLAEYHLKLDHLWAWITVHPFTGLARFTLYRWVFKKFNGH